MKKGKNIWKGISLVLLILVMGISGFVFYTGIIVPATGGKEHIVQNFFHFDNVTTTGLLSVLIYMVASLVEKKEIERGRNI